MPRVAASIRLANARKRVDDMLAKARARVDKILANHSTDASDAHANRLHRIVDAADAQPVQKPTRVDPTDVVTPDTHLIEATKQSAAASEPETLKTPIGSPLSSKARP